MERDYAALVQGVSPDAALIVTPAGRVVYWDSGAEALFGYSTSEAIGRTTFDLIVPPDRVAEEGDILSRPPDGSIATLESLRRCKDGSRVYVCITSKGLTDPATGERLVLLTKKDVTQLRVRRDTQSVEARFHDLLESVPDAIVIVNPSGHVVYVSGNAERLFGHAASELLGRRIEILLPARFHDAHFGHRNAYFGQPRTREMGVGLELFGLRKDGSEFPVEVSLSPMNIEGTTMAMSAIRDVSSRKRIERELREKNVALENASKAKDRFLASMSHELRTPLNAVIGFTGTLLMKLAGPLTAEQDKQLRTIQTSARHLLSLINDLLDIAKIEAQKAELMPQPVDCVAVVREVADTLRPQAEQKNLALSLKLPDGAIVVQADRRALSQIVINLTANAIKFTDAGSVVLQLAQSRVDGRPVVVFSVVDTGPGIQPQDHVRLFDPFARLGATGQRAKAGTGLGLYLSQRLAGLMGGRITCESELRRGSTFTLELPA